MERIGQHIRVLRNAKEWTLKDLSTHCGLSISFLSQIERGLSSLSITSLRAICEALGIDAAELIPIGNPLLTKSDEASPITKVVEQFRIRIEGFGISYHYLSRKFPGRANEILINEFPPNYKHRIAPHEGEEFGYVLKGHLVLQIEKEKYPLDPGDSFQFLASRPHGYTTPANGGARVLIVTSEKLLDSLISRKRQTANK